MTDLYYKSLTLEQIYANPQIYAWNCLLYYRQFTQAQLLHFREYLEMPELIMFQNAATASFLKANFSKEIEDCLEVDWPDVEKYAKNRE